jgi:meso-butanediol dehydrogenase / (S,S)-butanediol dehydrogenase / diacetyl reductase
MADRLKNKVAVITGTGDGIGRAAALLFASEGARVVGCDLDAAKLAETQRLVETAGGEMTSVSLDLSEEREVERLMDVTTEAYGGVDAIFHTAMTMRLGKPDTFSAEDMDYNFSKVATMSFVVAKNAIARMRERGGGSVVLCGSMSGLNFGSGFTGNTPHIFSYSAAKAAVTRLGIGLATEVGRYGIRVNVVAPGPIVTPAVGSLYGEEGSELHDMNLGHLAIRRLGQPDDVAWAALYLASDEASWVTGTVLPVDGGFTATGGQGGPTDRAMAMIDDVLGEAGRV